MEFGKLTLGNSIGIGDREWLLDLVGNHDDRRTISQKLANDGAGVGKRFELIIGELGSRVTVSNLHVLLADLVKNVRSLSGDLEEPSGSAACGVLGCEKKGEDGLGDFVVVEHSQKGGWLRQTLGVALGLSGAPFLGFEHLSNPSIHAAGNFSTGSHSNLALGSTLGEFSQNHVGGLLSVPGLGEGNDNGEVNQLQRSSDKVVVIGDLLNSFLRDIVSDKGSAGDGAHKLTELGHEGDGLVVGLVADIKEPLEVGLVHLLLSWQIARKSLLGEEGVQSLSEIDVGFAVKEYPVVCTEQLVCDIDDTGLDVGGGVEDLSSHIAGRCNNDEPRNYQPSVSGFAYELFGGWGNYLWKTETQLRGPLSHLPRYSSNLGSMDCKKGPMKGSFHEGPTMEPLLVM